MGKIGKHLICFQVIFTLFFGGLIALGCSRSIRYIMDVVTVALMICILCNRDKKALLQYKSILAMMFLWIAVTAMTAFVRGFSLLWMLWACRNWCRGFVLFIACILLLEQEDMQKLLSICKVSYVINFLLVIGEFLFLGQKGDYLGGIFGNEVGCNGYTNIFMCAVLILVLAEAFRRGEFDRFTWFVFLSSMIIAALEEIKIFYYEYPMIIALCVVLYLITKKGNKALFIHLVWATLIGFLIGLVLLEIVFPSAFDVIVGNKSYAHYEETSRSAYKISRSHGISEINEIWFGDSWSLRLFGLGLGNCETANFDFLVSDFAKQYDGWNYLFCCHHILYLEGGLIGLTLFIAIFLIMMLKSAVHLYRSREPDLYSVMGILFSLITIVSIVYNNGLRTDLQYLTYFILAMCCKRVSEPAKQEG